MTAAIIIAAILITTITLALAAVATATALAADDAEIAHADGYLDGRADAYADARTPITIGATR